MNIAQAKRIPIEEYLLQHGHVPIRNVNGNLWYKSPLRNESTPSFKVNLKRNAWYDFGIGQGGDVLDLVKQLEGVSTISEALLRISSTRASDWPQSSPTRSTEMTEAEPIEILSSGPPQSRSLLTYLQSRAICRKASRSLVDEVHYRRGEREFFGIGFANDRGGFEIRTKNFKGSLGAKDITTIKGHSDKVLLFEGFMDFLSYVEMKGQLPLQTVIVLNSVSMREKAIAAIHAIAPSSIEVFRDRDQAGEQLIEYLRCSCPTASIVDRSADYPNHKDLNEFLQSRSASLAPAI